MASEFKGLTIKFRGDSSDLSKALHDINSETSRARSNARDFQRALRWDGGNTEALRGKMQAVGQQLQGAKERADALEQALKLTDADGNPELFERLQARLAAAKADAEKLKMELLDMQATYDVQTTTLGKFATGLQTAGSAMKTVGDGMARAGDTLTTHVTAPLLAAGAASMNAAVDVDTALTGVRKTLDATEDEYEALKQAAIESSRQQPVSAAAILDIEALGAQLGFSIDELQTFSSVVSGLDIATDMNAEQAAMNLAQFSNIMGTSHEDVERYGSTVVDLGNHFATTESSISDMGMRIAAAGNQLGMSEADVLGLSAALTSMGVTAEAGGTAISTIMSNIDKDVALGSENLNTWAETAGMTAEQFTAAWKDDPVAALAAVLSGMDAATEEGSSMAVMLEELGISSLRQTDVMKRLAGNTDLMTNAVDAANTAWEQNSALQAEVDNRNESVASKFEVLKNRAEAVAIEVGGPLTDAALAAIDAAQPLIEGIENMARAFADMDTKEQQAIIRNVAMVAGFGPLLSGAGRVTSGIGSLATGMGKVLEAGVRFSSAMKNGATLTEGFSTALGMSSTIALPSAVAAIGGLAAALAAVGIGAAIKDWHDARERARELDDAVSGLSSNTEGLAQALWTGREATGDFGTAASDAKANIDGLVQSVQEHNRRNAETRQSAEESIFMLGQYKDIIDQCAGAGEVDAETMGKLTWALEGLEQATGESYEASDVLAGKLKDEEGNTVDLKAAIDDLIESKQQEARVNAISDMYTDALKEQMKAEQELAKAEEEYQKAWDNWSPGYIKSLQEQGLSYEEAEAKAKTFFENNSDQNSKLAENLTTAQTLVNGLTEETQTYANMMGDAIEQANEHWGDREGIIQTTEAMREACDAAGITNDGIRQLAEGLENAGVSTEQFATISGDKFAELVSKSGGDIDTLTGLIAAYASDSGYYARQGAQGVTDAVAGETGNTRAAAKQQADAASEAGKFDASGKARTSAAGVASGIKSAQGSVNTAAGSLRTAAAKAGDVQGMSGKGTSLGAQLASGMIASSGIVGGASNTLANATTGAGAYAGSSYGWGAHLGGNFASGISSQYGAVAAASASLAAAAKSSIGHSVPESGPLHEGGRGEVVYGEHMVDNLVRGMLNRVQDVRRASALVAKAASEGMQMSEMSSKVTVGPSEIDIQTRAITSWLGEHVGGDGSGNVYVTLQYDASNNANDLARDVARVIRDYNDLS